MFEYLSTDNKVKTLFWKRKQVRISMDKYNIGVSFFGIINCRFIYVSPNAGCMRKAFFYFLEKPSATPKASSDWKWPTTAPERGD